MAYSCADYENHKESDAASCYFDDDSSAEEELLRVAEKLEKTHQQNKEKNKEEAKKMETLTTQDFENANLSQSLGSSPPLDCTQSSSSSSSPAAAAVAKATAPFVPESIEIGKHIGEDTATSNPIDVPTNHFNNEARVGASNSVGLNSYSYDDHEAQTCPARGEEDEKRRNGRQSQGHQKVSDIVSISKSIRTDASQNDSVAREDESGTNTDRGEMEGKRRESSGHCPLLQSRSKQRKRDKKQAPIVLKTNDTIVGNNNHEFGDQNKLNGNRNRSNDDDTKSTAFTVNRSLYADEMNRIEPKLAGTRTERDDSTMGSTSNDSSCSSSCSSDETDLSDDDSNSVPFSSLSNAVTKKAAESILIKKKVAPQSARAQNSGGLIATSTPSSSSSSSSFPPSLETQNTNAANSISSRAAARDTNMTKSTSSNIIGSSKGISNGVANTGTMSIDTKNQQSNNQTTTSSKSDYCRRSETSPLRNPYLRGKDTSRQKKKAEACSSKELRKSDQQSSLPLKRRKEVEDSSAGYDVDVAGDVIQTNTAVDSPEELPKERALLPPKQAESSPSASKESQKSCQTANAPNECNVLEANNNSNDDDMKTIIAIHGQKDLREQSEVSPLLFAPPKIREGQHSHPKVQKFDLHSQPLHSRQTVLVRSADRLFSPTIVNSLWSKKFNRFNSFQSAMFDVLSHSDDNVVLSAPTGAGKSTIFEMAVARFLAMDLKAQEQQKSTIGSDPNSTTRSSSVISKARKIVYIAPSKALCEERYADWSQKLQSMNLGLKVSLITGQSADSEQATSSFADLIAGHLIVTTPEKWDSMTRRWNEKFFLFASVKLLLVDEVHLLGDRSRGWCLESVMTRMKTIHRAAEALDTTTNCIRTSSYSETNPEAIRSKFRIVAVSATLPNISDVADFTEAKEAYTFDDSYRPVSLTKHVNAMGKVGKNEFRFWSTLINHVPEIVKRFSHGKQSLIFCHSKSQTNQVMDLLIAENFGNRGDRITGQRWNEPVEKMLSHGIACHHAGMSKPERKRIEEAFLNKKISCLAATSTLAVGVNLPAHLVIIVGTKAYRKTKEGKGIKAGYEDIDVNTLLQMVGRAGRPGLDSTGVAVILTDYDSKNRIETLIRKGIGPVRSNLIPRLPEVMNSDISQQVITSKEGALRWFYTTFLFSTMRKEKNAVPSAQSLTKEAVTHLNEIGIVADESMDLIGPLAGSFIMNKRLLSFEEMETIAMFPFNVTQCQLLRAVSKLPSLQSIVRRDQKKELKEFHRNEFMKYKLPGRLSDFRVKDESEKAFILIQSYISRHKFTNRILDEEQITARNEAVKFLEAAQEYSVEASRNGKVAFECHKLQRSLIRRLWNESSGVFNQFDWIGSSTTGSNTLAFGGIRFFQDALESSEQELDNVFAKAKILGVPVNPGREVKHTVNNLCRRRLKLSASIQYTRSSNIATDLVCKLKYHDPAVAMTRKEGGQDLKFSLIAYTDNSEHSLLIFEEGIHSPSSFSIQLPSRSFSKICIHVLGTWVGFDDFQVIDAGNKKLLFNRSNNIHLPNKAGAKYSAIDVEQKNTVKKRKIGQPEMTFCSNQKQRETHFIDLTKGSTKEPSPITPTNDHRSFCMFISNNKQSLQELRKESEGDYPASQAVQETGPFIPSAQRPTGNTSPSVNITPFMRHPRSSKPLHGQSPYDSRKPESHFQSQLSAPENSYRHISAYQDRSPVSGTRDSFATLRKENIDSEQPIWNEPSGSRGNRRVHREQAHGQNEHQDSAAHKAVRSRNLEKNHWKQSRKKQQRAQKRAFSEKKMNPFSFFSHDPNDSERHLEQLSQNNSIIPNRVLAKLKQSSISSNRKGNSYISTSQDRRTKALRSRHSAQNPRQVLREKAFEQQYEHQRMMPQTEYNLNYSPRHHHDEGQLYTPATFHPVNPRQHKMHQPQDQDHGLDHEFQFQQQPRESDHASRPSAIYRSQYIPVASEASGSLPPERNLFHPMHDRSSDRSPRIFQSSQEIRLRSEENDRFPWSDLISYPHDHVDTYPQLDFPRASLPYQPRNSNPSDPFDSNFCDAFY